jgi:hypothetical protein
MNGRQGDPIYTQADWSGIGNTIAQTLGFAAPQSQAPSLFRPALQPQAQPSPALEARSPHSASPSASGPLAAPTARQSRPIADERRAFAAPKALASDRQSQCDRLASRGLNPGQLARSGLFAARPQRRAPRRCGFDSSQLAPSGELGFERASIHG